MCSNVLNFVLQDDCRHVLHLSLFVQLIEQEHYLREMTVVESDHTCESYIIPVRLGGILTKCLLNGKLGKIMALVMIRSRLSASDHSDECVG